MSAFCPNDFHRVMLRIKIANLCSVMNFFFRDFLKLITETSVQLSGASGDKKKMIQHFWPVIFFTSGLLNVTKNVPFNLMDFLLKRFSNSSVDKLSSLVTKGYFTYRENLNNQMRRLFLRQMCFAFITHDFVNVLIFFRKPFANSLSLTSKLRP